MEKKPSRVGTFFAGCFSGCLILAVVFFLLPIMLVTVALFNMDGDISTTLKGNIGNVTKASPNVGYTWRWGDGGDKDPKIARLYLRGIIKEEERPDFSFLPIENESREYRLITKIKAVTANKDFDGIWLEIDSPGGVMTLSDEIYHQLCRFKASDKGRFVFVYFKAQACSGGYYVAMAGDRIMGGPTAWTGSIGVIVSGCNFSKLADKLGIEGVDIASSENKAILSPLQPVNTNHVAIVQRVVDQNYERFLNLVSASRNIPIEKLRPIADGRILSSQDAKRYNLIDAIGYEEDAFEEVCKLAKQRCPESDKVRIYTVECCDYKFGFSFPMTTQSESLLRLLQGGAGLKSLNETEIEAR